MGALVILGMALILTGPVALVLVIILTGRVSRLEDQLRRKPAARTVPEAASCGSLDVRSKTSPQASSIPPEDDRSPAAQDVVEEAFFAEVPPATIEKAHEEQHPVPAEKPLAAGPLLLAGSSLSKSDRGQIRKESPQDGPAGKGIPSRPAAMEKFIGMKALNWAGVITTLFAAAYALNVAYDEGWLGEWGVSGLVYAAGAACIGLGYWLRRRGFGIVAEGLSALGFGVLYTASYCAYDLFHILSIETAFAVMTITTACGALLTAWYRSQIIAGLIFLGGYLTPVLLATGEDHGGFLIGYLALLGACAVSFSVVWRWTFVKMLSPIASYLIFFGWYQQFGSGRPGMALIGTAVFFLLFALSAALPYLLGRTKDRLDDAGLSLVNGLICFAFLYDILYDDHRTAMALVTFGLSTLYLVQFILAWRRPEKEGFQAVAALVLCVGFFTAAVPIQFGPWTTAVVWALEGAFLLGLGFALNSTWILTGSVVSHGFAVGKLLVHFPLHNTAFTPVFNPPIYAWVLVIAAFAAAAWWSWREARRNEESTLSFRAGGVFFLAHAVTAGVLLYTLAASECIAHFELNLLSTSTQAMPYVWLVGALISACYAFLSIRAKEMRLSFVALLFYGASLYSFAYSFSSYPREAFTFVANPAFLCAAVMVLSLVFAAWLQRYATWKPARTYFAVCAFAAGGLAYLVGAHEIIRHCQLNLDLSWHKAMPYVWLAGTFISVLYARLAALRGDRRLAVMSGVFYYVTSAVFLTTFARYHDTPFTPVLNVFFLSGLALALSGPLAVLLPCPTDVLQVVRKLAWSSLISVLFLLCSAETYQFFDRHPGLSGNGSPWALASLSVLWALFGATVLVIGFVRKAPLLRYTALALFGLTLLKVFLMDTASLEPLHRVLGFLTLGSVLIAGSFAYNRFLRLQREGE